MPAFISLRSFVHSFAYLFVWKFRNHKTPSPIWLLVCSWFCAYVRACTSYVVLCSVSMLLQLVNFTAKYYNTQKMIYVTLIVVYMNEWKICLIYFITYCAVLSWAELCSVYTQIHAWFSLLLYRSCYNIWLLISARFRLAGFVFRFLFVFVCTHSTLYGHSNFGVGYCEIFFVDSVRERVSVLIDSVCMYSCSSFFPLPLSLARSFSVLFLFSFCVCVAVRNNKTLFRNGVFSLCVLIRTSERATFACLCWTFQNGILIVLNIVVVVHSVYSFEPPITHIAKLIELCVYAPSTCWCSWTLGRKFAKTLIKRQCCSTETLCYRFEHVLVVCSANTDDSISE